jgi:sterol desaturase/sphingolipid hydroxylase (fatty acid hydroxylase superfamily)
MEPQRGRPEQADLAQELPSGSSLAGRLTAHLRLLGWLVGLLFAGCLAAMTALHPQLQQLVAGHRHVALLLWLSLLLSIPARFLAPAAAYLLELLLVGWSRSSLRMLWRPAPSVKLDLLSILMLLLPHRHLGYLLSFGLLYAVDVYSARPLNISVTPLLPLWSLQITCFLLFPSLVQYWAHRIEHAIPALWALHKFHHSADRMSILTSARDTQLLEGLQSVLIILPLGLITSPVLPLPGRNSPAFALVALFFAYRTFFAINRYFCHSNLSTGYGWVGRWLIVSPRMHRLHHAVSPDYHNKNFSNDLVIWDRLFGTYASCDPAVDVTSIPVGICNNPFNNRPTIVGSLREYFVTTYVVFWQELRKSAKACLPIR